MLLFLFTLITYIHAMTISEISTGYWGSIGTNGGVRLTVKGSGFGTPFSRPTILIGKPKVMSCK